MGAYPVFYSPMLACAPECSALPCLLARVVALEPGIVIGTIAPQHQVSWRAV